MLSRERKYWKAQLNRFIVFILSFIFMVPISIIQVYAENYGKNGSVRELSSQELVYDMGIGYNIGSGFDAIGSWMSWGNPWDHQTQLGNERINQTYLHSLKESGFKTIRLPISWANWINDDVVNQEYMNAVQSVVDQILAEDMYVIIDMHHDGGTSDISWIRDIVKDHDGVLKTYCDVWKQIASTFKDYGDHVIFESMNEVEFPEVATSKQYELLNELNQSFVDSIRSAGGNNEKRHLLIAGYGASISKTCDSRFQMPSDPVNRCILSVHYYEPALFCLIDHRADWCTPATTWGTEEEIAQVYADLDLLTDRFLGRGIPVIVGEYGVLTEDTKEKDSIRKYLRTVPEIMLEYGICPIVWDSSDTGNVRIVKRSNGEFYDPAIKAGYQQLEKKIANGEIQRKTLNAKKYKEIQVPITGDGWVSLASFETSKIKGIKFKIKSSDDWDSFGGGGILLDGWSKQVEYKFDNMGQEIVHMFSEDESVQDQIAIMIWWTDDSKGGNHVSKLSVQDESITVLYDEDTSVGAIGKGVRSLNGAKSTRSSGISERPNYSTVPGGELLD